MQKLMLSVAVYAAFVSGALASAPAPDEGTSTSTTSAAVIPVTIHKSAQPENKTDHFTTAAQFIHQEIYTHLYTYGEVEALKSLFATNRTFRDRIRVDLGVRGAFRLALQAHPEAAMLDPWKELLQPGTTMQHLIWARQVLRHENIKRLGEEDLFGSLLRKLRQMPDKAKSLALAAHAHEIFIEDMEEHQRAYTIIAALLSSRPLSDYARVGTACRDHLFTKEMRGNDKAYLIVEVIKSSRPLSDYTPVGAACRDHLFTQKMDGECQGQVISAVLASTRPLSDYATLGAVCKQHLFTEKMGGWDQAMIIRAALSLSDGQIAQLVEECKTRTGDNSSQRHAFIAVRARGLLAESRD